MCQNLGIEMMNIEEIADRLNDCDEVILVDAQKGNANIIDITGEEIICIDHHPTFVVTEYLYSDIRITGACSSIIAQYYLNSHITPDSDTATALIYGIKMDTLQFSRGVTPLDIEMFGYLYPLSDHIKLSCLERNNMEFTDLRAYGEAIEHIELYGKVGFSHISFSCPDALIAILADFILSLHEVDVAVVSSKRADGIKISLRSETSNIHAGEVLKQALDGYGDGGGHASMAGGIIKTENINLLGNYPEDKLNSLILDVIDGSMKSS